MIPAAEQIGRSEASQAYRWVQAQGATGILLVIQINGDNFHSAAIEVECQLTGDGALADPAFLVGQNECFHNIPHMARIEVLNYPNVSATLRSTIGRILS